ncbi:unnamed protein product [Mesocestoides corti]|uniref:SprT-like domain-containing protein n=1 Tax=Mesocestoides corti TaxID=53468 RepID=A0A3P6HE70_MESCO|nr:unnamed protein product [Mesocestoides corti]
MKNFKKNREELANRLLAYFNEVVFDKKLPEELEVRWNERLLKTAGQCVYMRRNIKHPDGSSTTTRHVRIELSGKVCTSAERVRDTLLHEACHAAVWVVHGVNDGHGRLWREFVRKANAAFPLLPPVTVRHTYAIDTRFTYRCTGCFATINRHSKSLNLEKKVWYAVGLCHNLRCTTTCNAHPELCDLKFSGVWSVSLPVDHGEDSTTRPRPPFADFVKEHYKHVRQQTPNHKETMAQLGSMFRSMKIGVNNDNVN